MSSALARAAIRNFVTYNPLFLFSALLLLGGAWLVNPPLADGGRDRLLVLQLFGAVQGYELLLLGAAWVLARRGLARDVRNIVVLVLAPFLMDISCTNALMAEQTSTWPGHLLTVAGLLALVSAKAVVASRLVGASFRPLAWAALLGGPLVVGAGPLAMSLLAHHGFAPADLTLASGVALGALVLLWGLAHEPDAPDAQPLRALAPVVLGVATWHALGTAWSHDGSPLLIAGPVLVALGPVLPRLAWPGARDHLTPLLLPALGALFCGLAGLEAGAEPTLGLTAWQVGLVGAASVHGLTFARRGAFAHLLGLLVAIDLLAAGATLAGSLAHVGRGPAEPLALLALFAYGLARNAHPVATLAPLVMASILTARLDLLGGGLRDVGLAVHLLAAGGLCWTHRVHGTSPAGAPFRFVACTLLWLPAHLYLLKEPGALDVAWGARGALVALLGLALLTGLRGYAVPALLLPLEALRRAAPATSSGWGALGIGLAFASVAGGVALSLRREAILAWLERRSRAADDDAPPGGTPAGAGRAALIAGLALVALALPLVGTALAGAATDRRRARQEVAAIGTLKAIATAQTVYRESDKNEWGRLEYARSLEDLVAARLVDPALASGVHEGYRFRVTVGDPPEFLWMATATPVEAGPGPRRHFAINQSGVLYMATQPFEHTADCQVRGGSALCK
ncbi:MAG: hypothetical protein M9894_24795 [Planctomycetes bacterium]|nr:hypothetical protein [Planctomycetota bacterium]